jgi:large subunit ribosomal protein L4
MQVSVRNTQGEAVGEVELRDDIFGLEPNVPVMHQALVRQLGRMLAWARTKQRSEER